MMKTPCTLYTRPRGPEVYLVQNPPLWELPSMIPEGTIQAIKRRKQPTALPKYDTYEQQQGPAWHDNSRVQYWHI